MVNLKSKVGWTNKIDKLIFVFASLYLITTLGWLWKQKQQSEILANTIVDRENTTTDITSNDNSQSDKDTSNLLLQPLIPLPTIDEIPNNSVALMKVPGTTNNTTVNIPPPLPPQPIINPVANQPVVVEIIENKPPLKVAQNNSPTIPILPTPTAPPPKVTSQVTLQNSTKKIVSTPKKLTQVPTIKSLQSSVRQESVSEQQTTNNIASTSNTETITNNNFERIDYKYSLLGVVQLPDAQSFALFKINELTEKVSVGAEIGTSGWVLMGVNGTQATISRQNKSLNIRVGETF